MKTLKIKFMISLLLLLPAYTFAEDTGGIDMEIYSSFVSYGFMVIVAAFFCYFIYCSTHPKVYIPKVMVDAENFLHNTPGEFASEMMPALNGIYYAAAALMILYAVTFIMQLL